MKSSLSLIQLFTRKWSKWITAWTELYCANTCEITDLFNTALHKGKAEVEHNIAANIITKEQ